MAQHPGFATADLMRDGEFLTHYGADLKESWLPLALTGEILDPRGP